MFSKRYIVTYKAKETETSNWVTATTIISDLGEWFKLAEEKLEKVVILFAIKI